MTLEPNWLSEHVDVLTEDLANFWTGGYLLIRKDLKGRYPKHNWRETPS